MFYLKKLGLGLLYVGVFFLGIFGYSLTLLPINLPYLLKIPTEADYLFAAIFAFLFLSAVVVPVRTQHCWEEGFLFPTEGESPSLLRRIVTSREWRGNVLVFAGVVLVASTVIGITSHISILTLILGILILTVGGTLVFALLDILWWSLSYYRAQRKAKKTRRNR